MGKDAQLLRVDKDGNKFNSFEDAKRYAEEIGESSPVGFVRDKGKSGQEFVVVKGIDGVEAKKLQQDASFAEFYDPPVERVRQQDIPTEAKSKGLDIKEFDEKQDMSDDLFTPTREISEDEMDGFLSAKETLKIYKQVLNHK